MNRKVFVLALLVFVMTFAGCVSEQSRIFDEVALKSHSAVAPVQSGYHEEWNQSIEDRLAKGNVDLVFIGDSITHLWTDDWEYSNGSEI